jgi:hypothetical protein
MIKTGLINALAMHYSIRDDHKGMALWREITSVARDQAQAMLLGDCCLKCIRQLPAMIAAQRCGKIRRCLINAQRRNAIEELRSLICGALFEAGQHFGTRDHGNGCIRMVLKQILACGCNTLKGSIRITESSSHFSCGDPIHGAFCVGT